jgi:predicted nucleotide-binding protein (sugar kinase/HSP70/actin superfamily)
LFYQDNLDIHTLKADFKNKYRRHIENPFYFKDVSNTTILFGGLTHKHEVLLQAYFENLGYKCLALPNPDFEALQIGKEFCDPGMCNPAYFTFGALLKQLRDLESEGLTKEQIIEKYVFITAGSCGPCRFGMYESQFRLGLANSGFDGFRVIVFQQNKGLDQDSGLYAPKFDHDFFLGVLGSFILGDLINDIGYQYRPFETEKGSVDKLLDETLKYACNKLKNMRYPKVISTIDKAAIKLSFLKEISLVFKIVYLNFCKEYKNILSYLLNNLKELKFNFNQVKPVVKITGEFWAQTTEGDGNLNVHRYLEDNGAQVIPEALCNWILYLLHQVKLGNKTDIEAKKHNIDVKLKNAFQIISPYKTYFICSIAEKLLNFSYNKYRKVLLNIPYPLIPQNELRILSKNYYNPLMEGGEGHLEIGKTLYYFKHKYSHVVLSVKPFGCMPSSMSDGIMSSVITHNPDILFSTIETGGEGIINMYSRTLLVLDEAKEISKNEYALCKEKTNKSNGSKNDQFVAFSKNGYKGNNISVASKFLNIRGEK